MKTPSRKSFRKWFSLFLIFLLIAIPLEIWRSNALLQVSSYTVCDPALPAAFDGFSVVHLSDLHGKRFGEEQQKLLSELAALSPDLIVITGDIVDSTSETDERQAAEELVRGATQFAPVYFVSGNHESGSDYSLLREALWEAGAFVLENESVLLSAEDGSALQLVGLSDPGFLYSEDPALTNAAVRRTLEPFSGYDGFSILLAHRPDYFHVYAGAGMNLTLSGHTHGGQIRLPFLGGILAPGQGFFPEYLDGAYFSGDSEMIISRGLGSTAIPIRFFNRPEIVQVTLRRQ